VDVKQLPSAVGIWGHPPMAQEKKGGTRTPIPMRKKKQNKELKKTLKGKRGKGGKKLKNGGSERVWAKKK